MTQEQLADTRRRAIQWLHRSRNDDGSLGYLPRRAGRAEPTLLAVAAGLPPPLDWLDTLSTAWEWRLLPTVLAHVAEAGGLRDRALARLQVDQGLVSGLDPGFDAGIPAWGWVPGTAPWVEPTCHALL